MSTDSKHIEIRLDADPRFAAAAAGGARYLGEASGLSAEASGKFQDAIRHACEEAFAQLEMRKTQVEVALNQFADRIEVVIVNIADKPSVGLHTLLGAGAQAIEGVDRVQYEQQSGKSITRLTKFLSPQA